MSRTSNPEATQTLLHALACGDTVETAAHKAGLTVRTAYRRLATPSFRQQLDSLRAEMVERTSALLTAAGIGSVKTLVDLQQDASVSPSVRRHAARDVLQWGLKYREATNLEQRVIALEERLSGAAVPAQTLTSHD